MSQALIQQARNYLHEHGYAFWYDASRQRFRLKEMGVDSPARASIKPLSVVAAYYASLDIIGVRIEHRKPLTPNQNL